MPPSPHLDFEDMLSQQSKNIESAADVARPNRPTSGNHVFRDSSLAPGTMTKVHWSPMDHPTHWLATELQPGVCDHLAILQQCTTLYTSRVCESGPAAVRLRAAGPQAKLRQSQAVAAPVAQPGLSAASLKGYVTIQPPHAHRDAGAHTVAFDASQNHTRTHVFSAIHNVTSYELEVTEVIPSSC